MKQKNGAKNFVERWKDHGYEKGEMQLFWIELLQNIFDVKNISEFIKFEQQINGKFIDARIPSTNVLIEQKSIDKNLKKAYQQAKNYDNELPYDKKSRWIVISDFQQFQIYDMNQLKPQPKIIFLSELPKRYDELRFLVEHEVPPEIEISLTACKIVKNIYEILKKSYKIDSKENLNSINKLCVRLVFCLYADDAGIFQKNQFRDYLNGIDEKYARQGLIELFRVLNTPLDERDDELDEILSEFPFVNGGLFAEDDIKIPKITSETKYYIFAKPDGFSWSTISPPIFGALFESTLNPEIRQGKGMHYTTIENIHKVIDLLFLNDLKAEFENCGNNRRKLKALQEKLSSLKFLDPACGSGNFLTETYLSLRRIENEILKKLLGEQIKLGDLDNPIKVSINQFYGIEINDFAVSVARTALWISELQMMQETAEIIHKDLDFLPLKTSATIIEGNALKIEWEKVDYIMGNPPFIGASMMTKEQKSEAVAIFGKIKLSNSIDYVGAWYHKAAQMIQNTNTKAAFVSTNSITQGEQVAPLWKKLLSEYKIIINFAYKTFKWYSEAVEKAQVHCVIIGFSTQNGNKYIIDGNEMTSVENINPYLVNAPNILIESRSNPVSEVPKMLLGNKPTDDGNFILDEKDYSDMIKKYPDSIKLLHKYVGARDFLNNKPIRYCIWLKDIEPSEYYNNKEIMRRLDNIKQFRLKSTAEPTIKSSETPYLFFFISQPTTNYIIIPSTSSERRKYIPIGFLTPDVIANNSTTIIPNANLYHFSVLSSIVHMAWTRVVCGRLEMRYRYSGGVVYNNFVWCSPSENQRKKIEQTAQNILDVRAKFPNSSLAVLYDENTMPLELRKAHQANDKEVMKAYNFDLSMTEAEIVGELMKMYQKLTS